MKIDQSKWKYCRDNWRKNNPDYFKKYYREKTLANPEEIKKRNERSLKWRRENKEKARSQDLKWREKNRKKLSERTAKWIAENREVYLKNRRISTKARKSTDPLFKFSENLRSLINMSFKRGNLKFKKKNKTEDILGCSLEFFKNYIISKCSEGIKVENFGRFGYHIDHIVPISSAQTEEDVIKLNHYTNLQPLWWRDNISKSNKLT